MYNIPAPNNIICYSFFYLLYEGTILPEKYPSVQLERLSKTLFNDKIYKDILSTGNAGNKMNCNETSNHIY